MRTKVFSLLLVFSLIFTLLGCAQTFNNTEYEYLTNPDNYETYNVKLYYHNVEAEDYYNDLNVYIQVSCLTLEDYRYFETLYVGDNANLDGYPVTFTIHNENKKILYDAGFYTDVTNGDVFTVKACKYVDNNDKFLFIASVKFNNKIYLDFEKGMEGITNYLDSHKSPFFK